MEQPAQLSETDVLRAHLARHEETCPVCGYMLHALTSPQCPECGSRLELHIASRDRRLAPWLCAMAGLVLPIGPTLMSLVFGLIYLLSGGGALSFRDTWFFGVLIGMLGVYVLLLTRLIRRRRAFWQRSRQAQIIRAGLFLVLGPASHPAVMFGVQYFV